MISDLHMPGERSVIRKDNVASHDAVMGDMAVREEISAAADDRLCTR